MKSAIRVMLVVLAIGCGSNEPVDVLETAAEQEARIQARVEEQVKLALTRERAALATVVKNAVKLRVSDPDNASFGLLDDFEVIRYDDGEFDVKSWVKHPNALGVVVKSTFVCRVGADFVVQRVEFQ